MGIELRVCGAMKLFSQVCAPVERGVCVAVGITFVLI